MGQVTLRVGGFSHPVSCEDGQESHLVALGAEVDRRIASIRQMGGGQFPEARLMLLAALLLADELHDIKTGKLPLPGVSPPPPAAAEDAQLAERIATLAEKVEAIARALAAAAAPGGAEGRAGG
jgi:cell division protein ZapA